MFVNQILRRRHPQAPAEQPRETTIPKPVRLPAFGPLASGSAGGFREAETGRLPGAHASQKGLGVREPKQDVLGRLTGGSLLLASGAVEDDLLISGMRATAGAELLVRDRALETKLVEPGRVFLGADQQRLSRAYPGVRLLRRDSSDVGHGPILPFPARACDSSTHMIGRS